MLGSSSSAFSLASAARPARIPASDPPLRPVGHRTLNHIQRGGPERKLNGVLGHDHGACRKQRDNVRQHHGGKRDRRPQQALCQQVDKNPRNQGAHSRPGANSQFVCAKQQRKQANDRSHQRGIIIIAPVKMPRPLPVIRFVLQKLMLSVVPEPEQCQKKQQAAGGKVKAAGGLRRGLVDGKRIL